jgi:hypothetical protein
MTPTKVTAARELSVRNETVLTRGSIARRMFRRRLPWIAAGLTLLFHALGNPHYGFFRDELYFIICGRHPDFGYVDQPSLTPLLSAASQVLGQSLFALRLVAALCAAAAVYITCLLVGELGGGAFAEILASICVALAPVLASFGTKVSTDMLGLPLWVLAALLTARALRRDPRSWIGAGAALGIAFNAKYSAIFFAAALIGGLIVAGERRKLGDRWFAYGALLGLALAVPNVAWQIAHGLPMLELLRNGAAGKNVLLSPLQFVGQNVLITNPILSVVWIAGLVWAFLNRSTRWIGATFVILIALMIALHAKDYYPGDAYPIVFAAGGCAIEAWTRRALWTRPLALGVAVACGLVLIPFAMPILPIGTFIAYQSALHLKPIAREHASIGVLPPDYADMLGWPEMTDAIAAAYESLPKDERARAMIYAANYGEAAAFDFYGAGRGLPIVTSHHNQYYLWGTRCYSGSDPIVISINVNEGDMRKSFTSVRHYSDYAGVPLAMPVERDDPIYISSGLKLPLARAWPFTKKLYY